MKGWLTRDSDGEYKLWGDGEYPYLNVSSPDGSRIWEGECKPPINRSYDLDSLVNKYSIISINRQHNIPYGDFTSVRFCSEYEKKSEKEKPMEQRVHGVLTKDGNGDLKLFKGRHPEYIHGEWRKETVEAGTELVMRHRTENIFSKYRVYYTGGELTEDTVQEMLPCASLLIVQFEKKDTKCVIRPVGSGKYFKELKMYGNLTFVVYTLDEEDAWHFDTCEQARKEIRSEQLMPSESDISIEKIYYD